MGWPLKSFSPPGLARARSGENQHPNGSQNRTKKIAGTRSDPGDCNSFEINHFQRAGDGTRTHDVQLGKLAFYQLNYAREVQVG